MTTTPVAPLADTDLLARVRAEHQAEVAAGRAKLVAVAAYAAGHRVAGIEDLAEGEVYADREVELAGPGAPGVSEFAVVGLAAVLGVSARSAKNYVGDALELTHRLPAVWARVLSSDLPAWRARSIAQRTKQLSAPAATWVDAWVGPVAHKLGFMRVNQLIEQAITYTQLSPGTYHWTSPSGDRYQRDRDGTTDLSRVLNDETPHDRRAYEPGEPVPSAPAIRGAISRSALPRCEIASFSATDSSAEVRPSGVSAATKSGS